MDENNQDAILTKVQEAINNGGKDILTKEEKEWLKNRYFAHYIVYINAVNEQKNNDEKGEDENER